MSTSLPLPDGSLLKVRPIQAGIPESPMVKEYVVVRTDPNGDGGIPLAWIQKKLASRRTRDGYGRVTDKKWVVRLPRIHRDHGLHESDWPTRREALKAVSRWWKGLSPISRQLIGEPQTREEFE